MDEGYGGGSMKRPSLQSLLAAAQSSERAFYVVLVCSLSRLGRSCSDMAVAGSLIQDLGAMLFSVSEPHVLSPVELFAGRMNRLLGHGGFYHAVAQQPIVGHECLSSVVAVS